MHTYTTYVLTYTHTHTTHALTHTHTLTCTHTHSHSHMHTRTQGFLVTCCDNKTLYLWSLHGKTPYINHHLEFCKEKYVSNLVIQFLP